MKQANGKNSSTAKIKSRLQNPRVVWGEMTQTDWIRMKNRVPRRFLSTWRNSGDADRRSSPA